MNTDWLKFKRYPHIGKPLTIKNKEAIVSYVTNTRNIVSHKFTPLLHREIRQRKYRPLDGADKNESGKRNRSVLPEKIRHIYYPTHLDSIIYSYYNSLLLSAYENYLGDKPFSKVATAYRKIPLDCARKGNKSNIEFAYDAFKFIEENKNRKLSIIVADVSSFFDNLNIRLLHTQWKRVLRTDNLPDHHYAVYKSLVNSSYVNENELFKQFKNQLIVERNLPNDPTKQVLRNKAVKNIFNLRQENVVAYCTKTDFFRKASHLIRHDKPFNNTARLSKNKAENKGIPQGTPLSATLANIYMLDFDEHIYLKTSSKKSFYSRYSDDIIIVCDRRDELFFYNLIIEEIETQAKLDIQPSKTNVFRYELNSENRFKGGLFVNDTINPNKQLEYLGFMYDGAKVRVKTVAFSKFYRKMKRSFRRGAYFAKQVNNKSDKLFETRLYKNFTHVGSKRCLKWIVDPDDPTHYKRSTHMNWGNFISYLNKANSVMKDINEDDTIINQYRKVWNNFHRTKKKTYIRIRNGYDTISATV